VNTSPDNQIAQLIANAIQRRMGMNPQDCFVAAAPDYDPKWGGDFIVEVVPGNWQPYGPGNGAQEGGALLREQPFVLWCFYRAKLDQYSRSTMLLIEAERGILDRFEVMRQLFAMTQLPMVDTPTVDDFALLEPIEWGGESKTEWEDPSLRVVRRSMTLICRYGENLPGSASIVPADYV